jgi:hypothetical protein
MAPARGKKFLFIHVMKTGGTSFSDLVRVNFDDNARYPDSCLPSDSHLIRRMEAYMYVPRFLADVKKRDEQLHIVRAHIPYAVRSLLPGSYEALTILREPVERTVSHLKHCRKYHKEHQNMDLEIIYEEPWFKATFLENYQTKIFSMSSQEATTRSPFPDDSPALPSPEELKNGFTLSAEAIEFAEQNPARFSLELFAPSTGVITIDEQRLKTAKNNLSAIDLVGVSDRYDRFLLELRDRYNWKLQSIPKRNVSTSQAVSPELRKRIALDNAADMELYEYATSLAP